VQITSGEVEQILGVDEIMKGNPKKKSALKISSSKGSSWLLLPIKIRSNILKRAIKGEEKSESGGGLT